MNMGRHKINVVTGGAGGGEASPQQAWTTGSWVLAVLFCLPVYFIADSRAACRPQYGKVGQGFCLGDLGDKMGVEWDTNSTGRLWNGQQLECEARCTQADNETDSSQYCIGYVTHSLSPGEATCGFIFASQAKRLRRTSGVKDPEYMCWEKEEESFHCRAIAFEASLSDEMMEYTAQGVWNQNLLDVVEDARAALEALQSSPGGLQAAAVMVGVFDPEPMEKLAAELRRMLTSVQEGLHNLAFLSQEEGPLHAGVPKFRLVPFMPLMLFFPDEYATLEFFLIFGPSLLVLLICWFGLFVAVMAPCCASLGSPTFPEHLMDFLSSIVLPLALLGLEIIALSAVFHEIFDVLDLGLFRISFVTTRNLIYGAICDVLSVFVSLTLQVNRVIPVGKAKEIEEKEVEENMGFVVHGSDANFKARMELIKKGLAE